MKLLHARCKLNLNPNEGPLRCWDTHWSSCNLSSFNEGSTVEVAIAVPVLVGSVGQIAARVDAKPS